MDVNVPLYLGLLVACVFLSAFFSSSETAFVSLQRIRLEHMVINHVKGAGLVAKMIKRPERLLATILLGNNLVNTAAASLATALAIARWPDQGLLIATIGVTIVLLIFAETVPKTIANRHSERLSLSYARPIEVFSWVFTPFVFLLSWITVGITRLAGGTPLSRSVVNEEEIRTMISVGHKEGTVEETEAKMLHRVFDFGDKPAREVMVPRPEVIWVETGTSIREFLKIYTETPLSRFPVYEETTDNVVGILTVKDVLMAQTKETSNNEDTIDELIRPAYFAPESKRISELFSEMRDENYRMAVIIDEHGGTAGIISLSRLLEEIVGAVGDEFAAVDKEYEEIDEHTFQIDGSMRIEEANEEMGLELPESEDYETVAGFILSLMGHIPNTGEGMRYMEMHLTVTEMRGRKIEKILLTRRKAKSEDAASQG